MPIVAPLTGGVLLTLLRVGVPGSVFQFTAAALAFFLVWIVSLARTQSPSRSRRCPP